MRPQREQFRNSFTPYFVSSQTAQRRSLFHQEKWARLLLDTIHHYEQTDFTLHAYVIMPDHFHLLIVPKDAIERIMQLIKGGFSFRARKTFNWNFEVWQQGFTDHRIRDEEDWKHHLQYIQQNPTQARLVRNIDQYPWIGFPNPAFPQGLKPGNIEGELNVRAEARTLHSSSPPTSPPTSCYDDAIRPG